MKSLCLLLLVAAFAYVEVGGQTLTFESLIPPAIRFGDSNHYDFYKRLKCYAEAIAFLEMTPADNVASWNYRYYCHSRLKCFNPVKYCEFTRDHVLGTGDRIFLAPDGSYNVTQPAASYAGCCQYKGHVVARKLVEYMPYY